MKWKQFRLKTTTEAEDIVSSMLAEFGIEGVQIEDGIPLTKEDKEQMFVDILPDIAKDDGTAYLTFYLDMEEDAQGVLFKQPSIPKEVAKYEPPVNLDELLDGLTLAKLKRIFESVMKRQQDKVDPIRSTFGTIRKEPVSLEARILDVMRYARMRRRFSFRQLLERQGDKLEIVVTFLAVLELMKIGKIHLEQENIFDDMEIETLEEEGDETELELDLSGLEG